MLSLVTIGGGWTDYPFPVRKGEREKLREYFFFLFCGSELAMADTAAAVAAAGDATSPAAGDTMKCIHCSSLGGDIDEVRYPTTLGRGGCCSTRLSGTTSASLPPTRDAALLMPTPEAGM